MGFLQSNSLETTTEVWIKRIFTKTNWTFFFSDLIPHMTAEQQELSPNIKQISLIKFQLKPCFLEVSNKICKLVDNLKPSLYNFLMKFNKFASKLQVKLSANNNLCYPSWARNVSEAI